MGLETLEGAAQVAESGPLKVKRKTKPWLQVDADFTQSALVKILERHDKDNKWRFLDLVCFARGANCEGRIVSVVGKLEIPWDAALLCTRITGDTTEVYQSFIDLCLTLKVLTQDADGVLCLPDWMDWWGSLAKTDAERQTDSRKNRNARSEDDGSDSDGAPSHCGHDDVTKFRDETVTEESKSHAPVTLPSPILSLQNRTETETQHNTTYLTGTQNKTEPDSANGLVSLEMQKSIPEFLNEIEFWLLVPPLFEQNCGKPWGPADRRKLEKSLREPWAAKRHPDWAVRYLALKYGCRHLATEMAALMNGTRIEPIDFPWGLACSMTAKYSDDAADELERMRRERAEGKEPRPPRFRKMAYAGRP